MNVGQLGHGFREAATTSANNTKLESAAHEFEASLMQQFLKPLQSDPLFAPETTDGLNSTDGDAEAEDDGGSSGALMSFGSEALAKAISERGGLGIASKILDNLRTSPGAASSTTNAKSK